MVNIGVPELNLPSGAMARTVTLYIISMRSRKWVDHLIKHYMPTHVNSFGNKVKTFISLIVSVIAKKDTRNYPKG